MNSTNPVSLHNSHTTIFSATKFCGLAVEGIWFKQDADEKKQQTFIKVTIKSLRKAIVSQRLLSKSSSADPCKYQSQVSDWEKDRLWLLLTF